MKGSLALVLILLAGCGGCDNRRIVYPGDGRLVIVDIAPELDACMVMRSNTVPTGVGWVVRTGIRYWDTVGVRLRTPEQLNSAEAADEAPTAQHVRVHGNVAIAGTNPNGQYDPNKGIAEYHFATGDVELYLENWNMQDVDAKGWNWLTATAAHEFGHAIGLDHVSDEAAVMYHARTDDNARTDLAGADVVEYHRVWGNQ